jgi:hypothetical protein
MENHIQNQAMVEKYHNALVELRNVLQYTDIIPIVKFCEKNHLNTNTAKILKKMGVLKQISTGRHSKWEWVAVEPNRAMAVRLVHLLQELSSQYHKVPEPEPKPIQQLEIEHQERIKNVPLETPVESPVEDLKENLHQIVKKREVNVNKINGNGKIKVPEVINKKSFSLKLFWGLLDYSKNN